MKNNSSRFEIAMLEHSNAIKNALYKIDKNEILSLKNYLLNNKSLFLTGVGKNADLMYKITKTMHSVSMKSFFIDPINAMHGDFGILEEDSAILASSKSGNTEELIIFFSLLKKNYPKTKIFLIHCNKHLKNNLIDYQLYVDVEREADHLNIIPTVSLCVIESILHSIICQIIEDKNFNKIDMLKNHPGGNIGRILS